LKKKQLTAFPVVFIGERNQMYISTLNLLV